jgi:hypothetical protein
MVERLSIGGDVDSSSGYPVLATSSKVITKSQGRITQIEYYRSYDVDSDAMIGLFCKEEYTYSSNKLTQIDVTWYDEGGGTFNEETVLYQTDAADSNKTREIRSKK